MSEETPGLAPITTMPLAGADPAEAPAAPAKTYDEAYVKGLRSESAGYRTRLKELEAAEVTRRADEDARKLAELSEVERLKVQLADTEKRARALEVQSVRARAAAKHSLPDDLVEFITAEYEAGALAQAEKLAGRLKPATELPPAGGRNPASGGEGPAKLDEAQRLDRLKNRIPALHSRVLRG